MPCRLCYSRPVVVPRIHFTFKPGRAGRSLLLALGVVLGGVLFLLVGPAQAAETTRVVSAGDEDNPYDFNLSLSFFHESRKGALKRETTSAAGTVARVADQVFAESRDTMNIRMDVGLLPDIGLFVNLPIVISDTRALSFDRSGGGCPSSNCADASNSSLLRDGILPGFGQATYGLDAIHSRSFASPSDQTFASPKRQGLGYLGFGLNWAMFNQKRVASEPTWLLGFEARVDVSKTMRFDPKSPKGNTGVGLGYHQFLVNTMAARRFGPLEPYVGGWYMFPIKTAESPFAAQGLGGNTFSNPQHRAFVTAGMEATVWEKPDSNQRISLELRLTMETRFLGLARSELWEPLSGSSGCAETPALGCRPGLDDRDLNADGKADPNSGITRSPTYGIFGSDLGLNVRAGEHVRFRGLFGVKAEQNRFMTDGRSGYSSFDSPGRRYYVQDAFGYQFLLDGALLF